MPDQQMSGQCRVEVIKMLEGINDYLTSMGHGESPLNKRIGDLYAELQGTPNPKPDAILVVGDVIDGLTFVGPFACGDDAIDYTDKDRELSDDVWVLGTLVNPNDKGEDEKPEPIEIDGQTYESVTIEREHGETYHSDSKWGVYGHGTYEPGSVLEGKPMRCFLDSGFDTAEAAQEKYPMAAIIDGTTHIPVEVMTRHLPDTPDV